ncbi:MAG: hypothetical protein ACT4NY_08465 [Pseudonocardiales bacterium]
MLAVRELAEEDAGPPEESPVELDFEFDVELDFSALGFSELDLSELDFSALPFSELDLSDVDLRSAPVWGLSDEPDSVGGAERLSVR